MTTPPMTISTIRRPHAAPSRAQVGASPAAQTLFLSPSDVARIVRHHGLPKVLGAMAAYLESDFSRWEQFEKTPRVAAHSASGVIELMPTADAVHYTFKYVNGHPGNGSFGLPTVMAFGVLAEVATGLPLLVSELTLTTAMRTAATSAMAAKALARPNARCMAIIGNGAQSEFQAAAFAQILGIRLFRLFDTDPQATAKLARHLHAMGFEAVCCESTAQAVRGADVVTTITADKTRATVITPEMIEPGMHINAVGGDCPGKTELHPGVLAAARVFVEFEPQTRIEGDIQQMPAEFAVTELWQVLRGQAPGRVSATDVTVFDSVGFAIEDFSALRFVRDAALELGLGSPLELMPPLADPKNLYALLQTTHAPTRPSTGQSAGSRLTKAIGTTV
jgi:ornithine cyclodeaminase